MIASELIVLFSQEECDISCECRHFEFRGILCSHILSVLPLVEITKVPSKYILQRWRKDLKRKHTFIKCSYDDSLDTPMVKRYDNLCKSFSEVAENGAESDTLYSLVMDGLKELKIKVNAHHGSHEVQEHQQTSNNQDMMSEQSKLVLSPLAVPRRGRPPSLRKKSIFDLKKARIKKQQKSKSGPQSESRRKKNLSSNLKDAQIINIDSSTTIEGNLDHSYCGAYEAGSSGSMVKKFQELPSDQPAQPCVMRSYIDLLQGQGDLMELLSQSLN
ncbi:hypothetical protein PR202_gb20742 [Eleusine coracana subsp. coracana]|uniref:Protein FAR1-RELATED SEQUENCE n=1 Tax=Eleusine coracana subsp. coracana TaxID=191504 RepID=A0AAV5FDC9_ELECO|nr:hypothetical protein PR202_gb20742 [Eleusine coracana subsp. coracana]